MFTSERQAISFPRDSRVLCKKQEIKEFVCAVLFKKLKIITDAFAGLKRFLPRHESIGRNQRQECE
jgi:hypothetical protein